MLSWKITDNAVHHGISGNYAIYFIFYWPSTKDEKLKYKLTSRAPGQKSVIGHFYSIDEAKIAAEACFSQWVERANLRFKDA